MVSESWRESFKQTATAFISGFVAENPDYSLGSKELEQGWTNHVISTSGNRSMHGTVAKEVAI